MKQGYYLGIDTSNYTTSVALVDAEGHVLANCKQLLPVSEGACGLRQSDALFAHTKALPDILRLAEKGMVDGKVLAVGVSTRPRAKEGSYMPCFLAGVSAAEAASVAGGAPLFRFSHQCGHFMAAIHSTGAKQFLDGREFLAFHLSGGTTEMLKAKFTEDGFISDIIGGTADISVGQLIDRIGVKMGLSFPAGAALELLAQNNTEKLPKAKIVSKDGFVNLSGFENKITQLYETTKSPSFVAAYTLYVVGEAISAILNSAPDHLREDVLFSGGVMSCRYLKDKMNTMCNAFCAEPVFSSDNAVGIALLARLFHQKESTFI